MKQNDALPSSTRSVSRFVLSDKAFKAPFNFAPLISSFVAVDKGLSPC